MTRFNISLQEGVDMVLWSLDNAEGGETLCQKSQVIESQIWQGYWSGMRSSGRWGFVPAKKSMKK